MPKTGLFWAYIDVFKAKNANIENPHIINLTWLSSAALSANGDDD
jgi:hypothetical protein